MATRRPNPQDLTLASATYLEADESLPPVVTHFLQTNTPPPYNPAWDGPGVGINGYNYFFKRLIKFIKLFLRFHKYVDSGNATAAVMQRRYHRLNMGYTRALANMVDRGVTRSNNISHERSDFLGRIMGHMQIMMSGYRELSVDSNYRTTVMSLVLLLVEVIPMADNVQLPQRMLDFLENLDNYHYYGDAHLRTRSVVSLLADSPRPHGIGNQGDMAIVQRVDSADMALVKYLNNQTEWIHVDHLECVQW